MRDIILNTNGSPEDAVLLTAAVRDLHHTYPGQFRTAVRTPFPAVWENNPLIHTGLNGEAKVINCELPSLPERNRFATHAIQQIIGSLNRQLGLNILPTVFRGDVHVSGREKTWISQVAEIMGEEIPFWVIVTGAGRDCTVKSWGRKKYQEVVDHFRDRIQFVHVGSPDDPELRGVVDLRTRGDLRQIIRLIFHAQGVLCPTTLHMHLAAAIEGRPGGTANRPCVVVAGGRESMYWQAYPSHQYIGTIGALACCFQGGCGKSRALPLRDGSEHDQPENLCANLVRRSPRCMEMIMSADVIRRIEMYFETEKLNRLSPHQAGVAARVLPVGRRVKWEDRRIESTVFRQASEDYGREIPPCPDTFRGRGIVICAGARYLPCAWVCIRMLRKLGCRLPVELWHLGPEEMDPQFATLIRRFGARCVDALDIAKRHPARELTGWPLKAYAIKHTRFAEILLLDADNVPVVNPEFLFRTPEYRETGAIFWPDIRPGIPPEVWKIFGTPYVDELEFESGQIVVNKRACWRALCLALWYNEHADFYYQHILGDKDTFHFAFRKLGKSFSFVRTPVERLRGTMCQHDFKGRRIFQHRNQAKWRLSRDNPEVAGFLFEADCRRFLDELRLKWMTPPPESIVPDGSPRTGPAQQAFEQLTHNAFQYHRKGFDTRRVTFNSDGTIGLGGGGLEQRWHVTHVRGRTWLEIFSQNKVICRLASDGKGNWRGRWNYFERMRVELTVEKSALDAFNADATARRRILFRAPLNGYTGYGLHGAQIVTDLQAMGYEFFIRAIDLNETFAPIPDNVRRAIVCQEHPGEWELLLSPPGFAPLAGRKTVYSTMWESTKLPTHAVPLFNRAEAIIVPTQWNASLFYSSGVERPIHIVPLGIKADIFRYTPMKLDGPCTFGTAGRLESGGTRKGINLVIDTFKKAFPGRKDVRLHVKIFPDCEVPMEADSRIVFNREYFSEAQLAVWFQGLTCFVSAARGEGWGLMQHQALATGRPIIGVRFGGTAEFFSERMGYPLDFELAPAGDLYTGCGLWAEPDEKHLVQLMREVYRDRDRARKLGQNAAQAAARFTWQASSARLRETLQAIGIVD